MPKKSNHLFLATLLTIGLLTPLQSGAVTFIANQQVPQGQTIQLLIPKFDSTEAKGSFEGKPFPFYEITKAIDPTSPITRAEFVQLIYLNHSAAKDILKKSPETDQSITILTVDPSDTGLVGAFPDVPEQSQFYPAIQFATQSGIISGYEDGLFHPFEPITRGQAAKIIINAFQPAQTIQDLPFFPDVPLAYSLREDLYSAVRAGVFKGYPDGKMLPNRSITFQEANLIIQRAGQLSNPVKISERQVYRAFLGLHRLSELGQKNLQIELKDLQGNIISENPQITVTKQYFASQHFKLAEDRDKLFGQDYQDKTWELIDNAKSSTHPGQLWEGAFIAPTSGEITVGFGDKLYINGRYAGSHFGLDIANREGTSINAANSGIIVLASDTAAYGNTIVIDHGQNVFTMYLHLAELKVKAGDLVQKNDLIATMGSTGLATGSHLHFTQFIGDIVVDSAAWYEGKF